MILAVHSDAGYCNKKNARSRAGGHFSLSNGENFPQNNGAILTNATIIKAVMSSAAKAELGALYLNAKEAVYLQHILDEMGHPQPRTPIQTNNTTAEEVINNKIQPKRTKAIDMRFHWLRDREAQGQFKIYWRPGGDQPRGLLYKASSTGASCQRESRIPHQSQRSSRSQMYQKHQTDHKHK
jgi:hypothetical protein